MCWICRSIFSKHCRIGWAIAGQIYWKISLVCLQLYILEGRPITNIPWLKLTHSALGWIRCLQRGPLTGTRDGNWKRSTTKPKRCTLHPKDNYFLEFYVGWCFRNILTQVLFVCWGYHGVPYGSTINDLEGAKKISEIIFSLSEAFLICFPRERMAFKLIGTFQ